MNKQDFWQQVEQRVGENKTIVQGGLPKDTAGVMAWVGLRFWQVGLVLSFIMTLPVWISHREDVLQLVRWLIWR